MCWQGKRSHMRVISLSCFFHVPSSETLGEIPALQSMLHNRTDIKVNVGSWKWSAASPWPPISTVKRTPLWSSDTYKDVRDRLLRPAPTVQLTTGGEFITIDTRGAESTAEPDEPLEPVPFSGDTSEQVHVSTPFPVVWM